MTTCRSDDCCQGRRPCPTPNTCAQPSRPIAYAIGYLSVFLKWRDHAAAKRAGHLAAITPREPVDWQAVVIWSAVAICFTSVLALTKWPVLVAALSF